MSKDREKDGTDITAGDIISACAEDTLSNLQYNHREKVLSRDLKLACGDLQTLITLRNSGKLNDKQYNSLIKLRGIVLEAADAELAIQLNHLTSIGYPELVPMNETQRSEWLQKVLKNISQTIK